jgi:hypothetical protein
MSCGFTREESAEDVVTECDGSDRESRRVITPDGLHRSMMLSEVDRTGAT